MQEGKARAGPADTRNVLEMEHVDVLIVGAGLSGIGAAHHLQDRLPGTRPTRSSRRATAIGGTWDLFRYPGVRSDSDMQTLGYRFRPWTEAKAIADGPSILELRARHGARGGDRPPHPLRPPRRAAPRGRRRRALDGLRLDGRRADCHLRLPVRVRRLLPLRRRATGPTSPASSASTGELVHPQFWPEDLDYAGKRVVVIGSGATAVTLVPALTDKAAHVTMLQRSPSYILSIPSEDPIANALRRLLGDRARRTRSRAGRTSRSRRSSTSSASAGRSSCAGCSRSGVARAAAARATTSTRTSTRATGRGTSGCAWSPTATCSARSRAGKASIVTDRDRALHARPACGSPRAPSSTPTSSSPRPA